MKNLLFIILLIPQLILSDEIKDPLEESNSIGIACALVLEKDYNFRSRMEKLGCKKGDPIMFYNHAGKAKWEIILPVRMAALSVCDMSQPISQIGAVGSGAYQSLMCTFSGEYREVKTDGKLKGWNWSEF